MTDRISRIATALVILMGAIHLLSWHFNFEGLTTRFAGTPYGMKPNTALCFVFCGIALGLLQQQRLSQRWRSQ
ncbi:MAG TPA: hypothetical protein V6D27_08390, partial [Vampirovibrionales bacterium]